MSRIILPRPGIRRVSIVAAILGALAIGALVAPPRTLAQEVRQSLWSTDGTVDAVVYSASDNLIYIGGAFTRVGPPTGGFAGVDIASGATLAPYAQVNGTVYAQAPDGSGGWFIGGSFTSVCGQARNCLAHLDASGDLTPWDPNANTPLGSSTIYALAVDGNTLYAGGNFGMIGGQTRYGLAAVDAITGAVTGWNPSVVTGTYVSSLLVSGSVLCVGGSFSGLAGVTRHNLASFDLATGGLTGWDPNADGAVSCLMEGPFLGMVTAGGSFANVGGQPRSRLAMLDETTGAANSWNPAPNGSVLALASDGNAVFAGGQFTTIGPMAAARSHIAELDEVTGAATSWNPGADGDVRALVTVSSGSPIPQTTLYAAGGFHDVGGVPRNFLAAIDGTGTPTAWAPYGSGTYSFGGYSIGASGGAVYAGGDMSLVGSVARHSLAALDATSGVANDFDPAPDGGLSPSLYGATVQALLLSGNNLFVAGNFTTMGGQLHNCLAAVDATSGAPLAWNLDAGPEVTCMIRGGSSVFVGGGFGIFGGLVRHGAAAFDATTGTVLPWNPDFDNMVRTLAVRVLRLSPLTGFVFAGGDFLNVGGVSRPYLASVDVSAGTLQSWNTGLTQPVHAIAYTGCGLGCAGTIWAGGPFSTGLGGFQHYAAAFDAGTGALDPWNPGANGSVETIYPANGVLYVGGLFTSIGNTSRQGAAALDPTTAQATSWNPQVSNDVSAYAFNADDIYLGGTFSWILGASHWNFGGVSNGSVTAVEEQAVPAAPDAARATPNPFASTTSLRFSLARAGATEIFVYTVTGRLVRRLHPGTLEEGPQAVSWDGRDDAGRAVGSGVYLLRVRAASQQFAAKVLRLR